MNTDPTDAEWLRVSAGQIQDSAMREVAFAQVKALEAQVAMNRANEGVLFSQVSAFIQSNIRK